MSPQEAVKTLREMQDQVIDGINFWGDLADIIVDMRTEAIKEFAKRLRKRLSRMANDPKAIGGICDSIYALDKELKDAVDDPLPKAS